MGEHPIQGLMHTAMESLKQMVDVNTVVGDAVEAQDGTVIVPVSRVSVGFVAGGGEYGRERRGEAGESSWPFAGGSGAGVSVQPVGFLVVGQGRVRLLPVAEGAFLDRVIDAAPEVIDRVRGMLGGRQANGRGPGTVPPGTGPSVGAGGTETGPRLGRAEEAVLGDEPPELD